MDENEKTALPKVGDRIVVCDEHNSMFMGAVGVVQTVDTTDSALPLNVEFTRPSDGRPITAWIRKGTWTAATGEEVRGGITIPANVTLPEALSIIERVGNDLSKVKMREDSERTRAIAAEMRLTTQQGYYRHDMTAIDTIMLRTKGTQDWCDDGYKEVAEEINDQMQGGYEFTVPRKLVKKTVLLKGEVRLTKKIWVYEDEDEDNFDNWKDEAGEDLNIDINEALTEEVNENGWDETNWVVDLY